jgi:hypothetical protein
MVSTDMPLQLIHIDLFGSISTMSLARKIYVYMIVDYYSRLTWIIFLEPRKKYFKILLIFAPVLKIKKET